MVGSTRTLLQAHYILGDGHSIPQKTSAIRELKMIDHINENEGDGRFVADV
jgi:hypothetical protein